MKKQKKHALVSAGYYLASVNYYLASMICFLEKNDISRGIVWLCLGSAMLCLGSTHLNKKNKEEEK